MPHQLTGRGTPSLQGRDSRIVGRVTRSPVEDRRRRDYFRVVSRRDDPTLDLSGYGAVLVEGEKPIVPGPFSVAGFESLDFLKTDYVAILEPGLGLVQVVYRPESKHNFLFATERCSSRCLMCSQPPRETAGEGEVEELLRIIDLIPDKPEHLGITGGEPTLLGNDLLEVIQALRRRLPETAVTMLTNGRLYCYEEYVHRLAVIGHPSFVTSIPLHGDCATDHDYIAQVRGAFDQTVQGLYNAATHRLRVEIRVVLHQLTIPILHRIVEFVYRNLPFVEHVALMGLESIGFARARWDLLHIDPVDYAGQLEEAVRFCWYRRIPVSVYNLPLCVLPRDVWGFARQSISDYKNVFADECVDCAAKDRCSGLFSSGVSSISKGLHPIKCFD